MKSKEEIEKKLNQLIERKKTLTEIYNETMSQIENCQNQFENKEYQMIDRQIILLSWVLY
jgi:hypothetical protein